MNIFNLGSIERNNMLIRRAEKNAYTSAKVPDEEKMKPNEYEELRGLVVLGSTVKGKFNYIFRQYSCHKCIITIAS
jgi:hypothetical protein